MATQSVNRKHQKCKKYLLFQLRNFGNILKSTNHSLFSLNSKPIEENDRSRRYKCLNDFDFSTCGLDLLPRRPTNLIDLDYHRTQVFLPRQEV